MTSPCTHVGLEQRVLARLTRLGLPCDSRIIVGFSGGCDSLALAAVLARVAPVAGVRVTLLHVDHTLRRNSAADAAACREFADHLDLPFVGVRLPAHLDRRHAGVGVEEAARRERYVALARELETAGAGIVAVAHHLEDQAETVMLHLLRGAGLSGAAGMAELTRLIIPWWTTDGGAEPKTIALWRPLLAEPRAIVRDYAKRTGLTPVEDPSNVDPRFRRNRLRHDVMPVLRSISPGADAALARYASVARAEDALLSDLAEGAFNRANQQGGKLDAARLNEEPMPMQRRVIRVWLRGLGAPTGVRLERIDAVLALARQRRGNRRIEIGEDWTVSIADGALSARHRSEHNRGIEFARGREQGGDVTVDEPKASGIARILIPEEAIQARVRELAGELDGLYGDEPPLMVGVLTGAVAFMTDLMRAMTVPVIVDYMAVSSYGASTKSSGVVRILKDLNDDIEGRRLLVVEDIVDSGLTLQYLLDVLRRRNPAEIRVVALLKKEKESAVEVQVDRIGFSIPDEFVVGYGLDFGGRYRNLPYVAVLDERVISGG